MLDDQDIYEITSMSDTMLVHNMRCAERILAEPAKFPHADMDRVQARWAHMVGEIAGRALPEALTA